MSTDHAHETDIDLPPRTAPALAANQRERASIQQRGGSSDPTRTKTLRSRYSAEMYRRFRALKGVIREAVIDRDVLGLTADRVVVPQRRTVLQALTERDFASHPLGPPGDPTRFEDWDECVDTLAEEMPRDEAEEICGSWEQRVNEVAQSLAAQQQGPGINLTPPQPGAFDFPSDERKVEAFMQWLREQMAAGVLEADLHASRRVGGAADGAWQHVYIREAYRRGVDHAEQSLRQAGVSVPETAAQIFNAPRHADAAGLIYTRAYRELDGVTDAVAQEMSRTLAEGITQGWNPNRTARELNDRVSAVGVTRGRLIARTETVRAYNEAALNRYSDFGARIEGVGVVAEFLTAGDARVCPECEALEGRTFSIEEARGLIPVHPRCRCVWVAITS